MRIRDSTNYKIRRHLINIYVYVNLIRFDRGTYWFRAILSASSRSKFLPRFLSTITPSISFISFHRHTLLTVPISRPKIVHGCQSLLSRVFRDSILFDLGYIVFVRWHTYIVTYIMWKWLLERLQLLTDSLDPSGSSALMNFAHRA